jgi:hypothetical protein
MPPRTPTLASPVAAQLINLSSAPLPPEPLIGRAATLEAAERQLQRSGVLALAGIAGSGKSAVAAALAARHMPHVHWIDLYTGLNTTAQALLLQIASPLADMNTDAWQSLHLLHQIGRSYPLGMQLQMVLQAYAAAPEPLTLVIDRAEQILETDAAALIGALCDHVARGGGARLQVIVAGRELPYALSYYALPSLTLLDQAAIAEWAAVIGSPLAAERAAQIQQLTGGLPAAIIAELGRAGAAVVSTERLLWDQMRSLSLTERELLIALARGLEPQPLSFERRALLMRLEDAHFVWRLPDRGIVIDPVVRRFILHDTAV